MPGERQPVLRRAGVDDGPLVWRWRNDAATRAASFQAAPIPLAAHLHWFNERIADGRTRFLIAALPGGDELGYVRFDVDDDVAIISVALEARFRGCGWGRAVIRASARLMLDDRRIRRIEALVKPANHASLVAFESAGFSRHGTREVGGVAAHLLVLSTEDVGGTAVDHTRILFRVDAGAGLGLGHLQRCIALAEACQAKGMTALFLINDDAVAREWVVSAGFAVLALLGIESWSARDLRRCRAVAAEESCRAVVIDSEHEGDVYQRELREQGLTVVAIEDYVGHRLEADIVVNGDIHAEALIYDLALDHAQLLLGTRYTMLRSPFWRVPLPRPFGRARDRVLVLMGGADADNLLTAVVETLLRAAPALCAIVVVGPLARASARLADLASAHHRRVELRVAPRDIATLVSNADLAISAAGQTLYELAWAGVPTVAVPVAANQVQQLRAFQDAGAVSTLTVGTPVTPHTLVAELLRLRDDEERCLRLSAAARRLVDGQGALRVADAVAASVGADTVPLA